ncbi:glycosyltransferase [Streptococcus pacificus]|uniref:Glycosyltransferase n=1 Tax=Streptococcus pacificus TaxID=2740577 RepID=A0ABS0ZHY4_9STRE|nr:glycosyltransferase [Streptococcus pacificus]MBJ8325323.1 glycosyltransferase [Streptococcus pacificus]
MKKNILFISPTGTLENGAEISITNLMTHLSDLGYQVFNVFPNIGHPTQKNYELKMTSHHITYYKLEILNWWWEESPSFLHGTTMDRSFFYEKNINEIRTIIAENDIDVVISNTVNVFQGAIAASLEKKKHIWLIHEFPKDEFDYYTKKIEFISDSSDAIFAVDGPLTHKLKELFPKSTQINSFTPMTNFMTQSLTQGESTRFVSISKINDNKNQLELLEAYKELNRVDIPLVFIGDWDSDYKKQCDAYIEDNALANVTFLGNKEQPWDYVTDKDICVFTSKVETFGLVFLEAVKYAVPTISSNNEGYQFVADKFRAGRVYPLGNIERLKEEMFDYLENFDARKLEAINNSKLLKDNNPNYYYSSLIEELQIDNRKNKVMDALSSIVGNYNPDYHPFQIHEKFVSVYFSDENNQFNEKTTLRLPFRFKDTFVIKVPLGVKEIRVDLSETPNFFNSFSLINQISKQIIKPKISTHVEIEEVIVFDHNDPQIVYNVESFEGKELLFSYELVSMTKILKQDYIEKIITFKNNELRDLNQIQDKLNEEKASQESQFSQLENQYNAIVNSRRWQITTKLINLFRRKK